MMLLASFINLLANLCWVSTSDECVADKSCAQIVIWPVTLMGISYGLFAGTSWNALCYLVRQNQIGMTLGIASSLLNICGAVIPPIMGKLQDETNTIDYGFYWITRLSSVLSLSAVLICIIIFVCEERSTDKNLALSVKTRNLLRS